MFAAFTRSIESIRAADQRRPLAGVIIAALLFAAWMGWLFGARVTRYEVSESARLEVDRATHRVAAPVAGQVAQVHFGLDAQVAAGDVLVTLDDRPLRHDLEEKRARLAGVLAQLEPIRREIATRERGLAQTEQAGRAQVEEARARVREASAAARFQDTEAQRAAQLRAGGFVSESTASRATAEAQVKEATAEAQTLAASRADAETQSRWSVLAAELASLERQAAALRGDRGELEAAMRTLQAEIERRRIRAPIAGRIGEITPLRAGSYLQEGDLIAAVVPGGELRVVAEFPLASIGRLENGQHARVRLDAFPWTEFGAVPAAVQSVGTEAREGRVRVELGVLADASSPIHLQHGLAGTVLVEVEQVSPATLVLRAAGQLVHKRAEAAP